MPGRTSAIVEDGSSSLAAAALFASAVGCMSFCLMRRGSRARARRPSGAGRAARGARPLGPAHGRGAAPGQASM